MANPSYLSIFGKTVLPVLLLVLVAPLVSGQWNEDQKLLAFDGQREDHFGAAVSISGDIAVVGAPFDLENGKLSGSAYIYRFQADTGTWSLEEKLLEGSDDYRFGCSVAVNGDIAGV